MIFDTIVAPATPPGYGGVSIIRISGNLAEIILKKVSKRNISFLDRVATFSGFYNKSGEKIDDALITFFKNPSSYTGEDVVEISCHGNPFVVDQLVSVICNAGARIAEPGEFTKRAFLNGKLDLIQAESVSKLIGSRSIKAAEINNKILSGALSKKLKKIKESIIGVLAELEFEFDISEDELLRPNLINNSLNIINNSILKCISLIVSYMEGRMYNHGAKVVIFGDPNVGKSTLFNSLLEKDRAITSEIPGTTRDTVDAQIILNGIPLLLVDTAGMRDSINGLESEGIARSIKEMEAADLLLHVVTAESTNGYHLDNIIKRKRIVVFNKCDLQLPSIKNNDVVKVSAINGNGITNLKKIIGEELISQNSSESDVVLTTRRQEVAITNCKESLLKARAQLEEKSPELELVSFDIRESINHIDVLLGKTTVDDILNKVFSGFCVGK